MKRYCLALDLLNDVELINEYNPTNIIQRRIERLLWTGDLDYRDGRYYKFRKYTLYMIRRYFEKFLLNFFPQI